MRSIFTLIWKEFAHIKADPLMVRLIFFPVLVQLFVIGYAITTDVKNTPIAVVDYSNTPVSRDLITHLKYNELFRFVGLTTDERHITTMLDKGEIRVGLVIPPDFGLKISNNKSSSVYLRIDGEDANSSQVAVGYMNSVLSRFSLDRVALILKSQGMNIESQIPIKVSPVVMFNPRLDSTWYMIPALVVILVALITGLLTGLSIVKEKEKGTFEQLLVTPITPIQLVVGKIIPFVIIGVIEIVAFFAVSLLWFRIPFKGDPVALFVFAIFYMMSSLGIGILASMIARTSQQVLFLLWFILIFFIMLSGFFIPIENMPGWVQIVTAANPVRFFMFIVRSILLKGATFVDLWREGLAMLFIGIAVFWIALSSFQRRAS